MSTGFVYVLTNKAMPGLVKIGFSARSAEERAAELSTTGVPFPFLVAYCAEVSNAVRAEAAIHVSLAKYRVSTAREFFRLSVEEAIAAVEETCGLGGSPLLPDYDLSPWSQSRNYPYHCGAQKYYPNNPSFSLPSEPQTWFQPSNLVTNPVGEIRCPYCEEAFPHEVTAASIFLPPLTVQCPSCRRTIFLR